MWKYFICRLITYVFVVHLLKGPDGIAYDVYNVQLAEKKILMKMYIFFLFGGETYWNAQSMPQKVHLSFSKTRDDIEMK